MQNENHKNANVITTGKVLVLVDWDNLFISLFNSSRPQEFKIEPKIEKLMAWAKRNIGQLFGNCGFAFVTEHFSAYNQEACTKNNIRVIVCPKRRLKRPKTDRKTGKIITEEDTVDESIIWFAKTMLGHPDFKFICLVAGDSDYIPILEELGEKGIIRAIAVPTINSLSRTKNLIGLADNHPITGKKLLIRLDE